MTKKMLLLGILGVSMTATLHAQVLEVKSMEDVKPIKGVKITEDGSFEISARNTIVFSKESFKIDPAKTYKISGEFKSANESTVQVYLGFAPKDARNRIIGMGTVNPIAGTDTELVEACQATDTQVKVKDASKWRKLNNFVIYYNTREDFSDLPNTNRINSNIKEIAKEGDIYVLTLEKPVGKALEAGTKIRQQGGGGYLYTGGSPKVTGEWKTLSGTIKGLSLKGWNPKIWPVGTVFAEVVFLGNWGAKPEENAITLVRNIKVEEVE